MKHTWIRTMIIASCLIALAGCTTKDGKWGFPYAPSVQQGNWITQQEVDQLKVGMTKFQVSYLLGQPLLIDVFNENHWTYVYYYKLPYNNPVERKFQLWFDQQGKLIKWEGDKEPTFQPYEASPAATVS